MPVSLCTSWFPVFSMLLIVAGVTEDQVRPRLPYSQDQSRAFAALTQASYCDDAASRRKLRSWDCPECKPAGITIDPKSTRFVQGPEIWQDNATFVLVSRMKIASPPHVQADPGRKSAVVEKDGCLISWRGSDTLTNWIRDLQVWEDPVNFTWCENCEVQDGFYRVLTNVMDKLLHALESIGCVPEGQLADAGPEATNSLFVTGHSLGAAVGTVAMFVLQNKGFQIELSHHFESPRVGNAAFARAFHEIFSERIPMWRITHHKDPVPHLPPASLGYMHVNYEVYYDEGGNFTVCKAGEDASCSQQFSLWQTFGSKGEHCKHPLATKGSLCWCPWITPPDEKHELDASEEILV